MKMVKYIPYVRSRSWSLYIFASRNKKIKFGNFGYNFSSYLNKFWNKSNWSRGNVCSYWRKI